MSKRPQLSEVLENLRKKFKTKNSSTSSLEIRPNEIEQQTSEVDVPKPEPAMNKLDSDEFNNQNYPHSEEVMNVLEQRFNLEEFKPNQLPAINAALLGHDCFVLMPTGGGKSLCYQLPALITLGVTVVVSPLKSLIIDQVQKLEHLGIPSAHLLSNKKKSEVEKVMSDLGKATPTLKLLYLTPEKISASEKTRQILTTFYLKGLLARFVVDEAHCISQQGRDFRPDYQKLHILRSKYPTVPVMVLTASATLNIRNDILKELRISSTKWFISSFNRSNLKYTIKHLPKKDFNVIATTIRKFYSISSGIVYCYSRKNCDELANLLRNNKVNALSYHAEIPDVDRLRIQNEWMTDKVKVIVATVAFGLGVDKPNVRFVIHATIPKSLENYYQESGRAGRDGKPAECILFFYKSAIEEITKLVKSEKYAQEDLKKIVDFCNSRDCRRSMILEHFGEASHPSLCFHGSFLFCDNCTRFYS